MAEQPPHPPDGWLAAAIAAVRSLTLTNVLIIFLLLLMAAPSYFAYQLLNDPTLLDRFLSSYTEHPDDDSGCTVRAARVRGGPLALVDRHRLRLAGPR